MTGAWRRRGGRAGAAVALALAAAVPNAEGESAAASRVDARLSDASAALLEAAGQSRLLGRHDEARALVEAGLAVARAGGHRSDEVRFLVEAALIARQVFLYRRQGLEQAEALAEEARSAAEDLADSALLALALDVQARIQYAQRLYDPAADYAATLAQFQRAVELRREGGDRRGLAESLFHVGVTYERLGQPESALELHREALEIARQDGFALEESYAQRHIAYRLQEERPEEAIERFRISLERREQAGFRVGLPFARISLGDALFLTGRLDEAEAHYREALEVAEELDLTLARVFGLLSFGDLERERGRGDTALWYYRRALLLVEHSPGRWNGIAAVTQQRLDELGGGTP